MPDRPGTALEFAGTPLDAREPVSFERERRRIWAGTVLDDAGRTSEGREAGQNRRERQRPSGKGLYLGGKRLEQPQNVKKPSPTHFFPALAMARV